MQTDRCPQSNIIVAREGKANNVAVVNIALPLVCKYMSIPDAKQGSR